jgi:hypothetical protein
LVYIICDVDFEVHLRSSAFICELKRILNLLKLSSSQALRFSGSHALPFPFCPDFRRWGVKITRPASVFVLYPAVVLLE